MVATKLEKATRSRNAHRTHALRYVAKAALLTATPASEMDEDQLQQLRDVVKALTEKVQEIARRDEVIEDLVDDKNYDAHVAHVCGQSDELQSELSKMTRHLRAAEGCSANSEVDTIKSELHRLQLQVRDNENLRSAPSSPASGPSSNAVKPHMKLQRLEPPTFSGEYIHWTSFSELFTAAVLENSILTDVERMQYLKQAVKGDASHVISAIPLSGSNFSIAWDALCQRYGNKRAIVRSHVHSIVSCPAIKGEDHVKLRQLLQTVEENKMALERSHDIEVDSWDSILIYLVSEKMDPDTRRQWELACPGTDLQTYSDLKAFLEKRAMALEAVSSRAKKSEPPKSQPSSKSPVSRASVYHSAPTVSCSHCNEDHHIYHCQKFQSLSISARSQVCQKSKLCFNCLRSSHSVKDCPSKSRCRECKGHHHTLLHRPTPSNTSSNSTASSSSSSQVSPVGHPGSAAVVTHGVSSSRVVLPTAVVPVIDNQGSSKPLRALLDTGAQLSFISESAVKQLHLKKESSSPDISITGVGRSRVCRPKGTVNIIIAVDEPISCTAFV
jgi:hypothetical protein